MHDLHIWAMGTSHIALTAQLVMPQGHADDAFLQDAAEKMHDHFELTHVTFAGRQSCVHRAMWRFVDCGHQRSE